MDAEGNDGMDPLGGGFDKAGLVTLLMVALNRGSRGKGGFNLGS